MLKITPTPWHYTWDDNGFHFIWADKEMPRPYICATGRSDPKDVNEANAEAIVSAVNNTYGIGISPEKVPKLLKALETIAAWPGNLPDERYTSKTGPNDAALRGELVVVMRSLAKSAIEKSKL